MQPFRPRKTVANGPEAVIQERIIERLTSHEWFVQVFIGNALQHGIPDLFAAHPNFGQKWIEVKYKPHLSFTQRQQQKFPKMHAAGIGIWVLFDSTDEEILKLLKPANWMQIYLNWINKAY